MASKLLLNEGIALVTGSATGIGKETAFAFAEAGVAGVIFADLNIQGAQDAARESKYHARHPEYRAVAVQTDIADNSNVQYMVNTAMRDFGRIDYFVHCAGIANLSSAATPDLDMAAFDRLHAVNTRGTLLCIRAVSHAMAAQKPRMHAGSGRHPARSLGRGSIIVLGSVNSYVAVPGLMSYVAGKHAVVGIVKTAALDNMKHHIRVNAVCPGWVDTPPAPSPSSSANGGRKENSLQRKEASATRALVEQVSPLRRMACPEEVADYIVFLCSPSATYINGTGLCVDAGLTLGGRGVDS